MSREAIHLAGAIDGIRMIDRGADQHEGAGGTSPGHAHRARGQDGQEDLRAYAPPAPKPRRARRVLLAVGALALAVAIVAVALPALRSDPTGIEVTPGTVLFDLRSPGTPLDEEHARSVGMQFPRLGQHLDSLPLREHVVDEHERNLLATGMGAFQNPHRVGSDEFPAHAEVAAETALKLRLDPVEPGRIDVNRQQ